MMMERSNLSYAIECGTQTVLQRHWGQHKMKLSEILRMWAGEWGLTPFEAHSLGLHLESVEAGL